VLANRRSWLGAKALKFPVGLELGTIPLPTISMLAYGHLDMEIRSYTYGNNRTYGTTDRRRIWSSQHTLRIYRIYTYGVCTDLRIWPTLYEHKHPAVVILNPRAQARAGRRAAWSVRSDGR